MLHNALLSCMMVAKEWVEFATERNTLRVSYPKGIQRSSYFISMPFTYGIPIMVFFVTEHWLLSQCLFIVRITRTDWTGLSAPGWTATGYSLFPCLLGKQPDSCFFLCTHWHASLPWGYYHCSCSGTECMVPKIPQFVVYAPRFDVQRGYQRCLPSPRSRQRSVSVAGAMVNCGQGWPR